MISMLRSQEDRGGFDELEIATTASYGLVVNTFYELEPESVESFKTKFLTHRLWTVGPLLAVKAGAIRGGQSSLPPEKVLAWLDACSEDNSVVYIGFGSQIRLTVEQTAALAAALETSGVHFIWTVRDAAKKVNSGDNTGEDEDVIPAGFEERVKEKERMVGGVVMLAWPMQADHFTNAEMLLDDLGVAVRVGENKDSVPDSGKLARVLADSVKDDFPERVRLMKLREKGKEAIKEGGSSYNNLDELVAEMCL
ncbi:hypothetical protein Bca4012_008585 [Brassica carinata]